MGLSASDRLMMDEYLNSFQCPQTIEQLFYEAWVGTLHHNSPELCGRAKTVSEALERLSELVGRALSAEHLHTEPALQAIRDDLNLLSEQIGTQGCLEHLRVTQSVYSPPVPTDLCSPAQYKYLQSLGFKGTQPRRSEVGRLLAKYKK